MDPGVQSVLSSIQTIVASGGGSVDFIGLDGGKLMARYTMGRDDERPERVPDRNLVLLMMQTAIGTYTPHVKEIELL